MAEEQKPIEKSSSGLALYVAENGGIVENPVLLLIDEDSDYTFVDVFVSEGDISKTYEHGGNFLAWHNLVHPEKKSFKKKIDEGKLTRIGPMPREYIFYRRA